MYASTIFDISHMPASCGGNVRESRVAKRHIQSRRVLHRDALGTSSQGEASGANTCRLS